MTAAISIFLLCLFILIFLMCIFETFHFKRYPSVRFYALTGVGTLAWILFYMLFFTDPDVERAALWYRMGFLGICFVPPMYIVFISKFINPGMKITKKYLAVLYALPVISVILVISNPLHHMFYKSAEIVEMNNVRMMVTVHAPYFYVHTLYFYLLSLYPIRLLYQSIKAKKNLHQEPLKMFLAVFWAGILINVLSLTKILPFSGIFDYTIVAFFCNHAILFIAIFFGKTTDMLVRGRETVFEHYSSAAIIMDLNKNIVQMNLVARDILNFRFELNNDTTYDDLIKVWFEKNNGHFEDDNGDMLAVLNPEGGKPLYYKILETPISVDKKTYIGSFVEMLDVTSNKELIAQLYELINRDGLTGVYNKRFFNEICQKYDSNQYLPLAIIFGDLNGLKAVNDTQGHEIGDHIIVKAAEILNIAATDEGTVVCRIGGDEFGVVIPNASRTMAERYIECVLRLCDEESSGTTEQISISLGFSIKTDMGQVLVEAIKLADMKMYENKRNRQWDT